MSRTSFNELLEVGAHFGHLRSKWNPAMAPFIFSEKNGTHIIDLNKTVVKLEEASNALKNIARSGKKILFVATKKQAKEIVAEKVRNIGMPFVTERWPGGMLTNFATIRKTIRKMSQIDKMSKDGTFSNISKKERLNISRDRAKLENHFGSIADLSRLPSAIFLVDINKEHIAVAEAKRLNIPTFAIVDTNSNPNVIDYPIPANDDASTSIAYIIDVICQAVSEGLSERKTEKETLMQEEKEEKSSQPEAEELLETSVKVKNDLIKESDDKGAGLNKKSGARKRIVKK